MVNLNKYQDEYSGEGENQIQPEHTRLEEYEVYNESGDCLGTIELEQLHDDITPEEMPQELEINGVTYYPQF